jgi:Ca-activated chloride channel family protein
MKQTIGLLFCLTAAAGLSVGCASSEAPSQNAPDKTGSLNVAQAGAQDFALFRSIVESGEVPTPDTLDPVGFFAEHAMDLPPADCGKDICVHPMLAVAPRFNKSNWTMAFVAMNTPLDPATLERPPLHLVVAIEQSDWLAQNVPQLKSGIASMANNLRPEDRISLVFMGQTAFTAVHAIEADQAALDMAIDQWMSYSPQVDLYDGLAEASFALNGAAGLEAKRIVLVTSGRADNGITDPARIVELGEAIAAENVALGVVGFGDQYKAEIPAALGSLGAGTYSYAADGKNLTEVLTLEGETALFPLATNFKLTVKPSKGYKIGRIYGVKRARVSDGMATLQMPALFIGQRQGSHDVGGGRRGGGGGLFVELRADPVTAEGVDPGAPAFEVSASWIKSDGAQDASARTVVNDLAPGENPAGMWPQFSDPERGKPFMMLNMYLALRGSVELYSAGDCARSMGIVDMMAPSVEGWQGKYNDPDINDDYQLMLMLRQNLSNKCQADQPIQPFNMDESYASCFFI